MRVASCVARRQLVELVGLGELRQLDRLGDEALERRVRQIGGVGERRAPIAEHAQAERARRRLLHQLRLAEADLRGQLAAVVHQHLGGVGAVLLRERAGALGELALEILGRI